MSDRLSDEAVAVAANGHNNTWTLVEVVRSLAREVQELRAEVAELRRICTDMETERDMATAEVERLTAENENQAGELTASEAGVQRQHEWDLYLQASIAGYIHEAAVERALADQLAEALHNLEHWDMLTLTPEGHGSATQDAPWARSLIREALAAWEAARHE